MKTTQHGFRLTALATALMAVFGTALADDAQINQMIKPDSSVSVGLGNWSGPRDQQGIYDGMRKGRAYGLFDADVVMRDDATGTWWTLKANNLGLENRDLKVEYLRQGDIGASFEYSRTLREDPLTFTTRLQGVGTTANVINIVPANPGPLQTVKMSTERDLVGLGFYDSVWQFAVGLEKTGFSVLGRYRVSVLLAVCTVGLWVEWGAVLALALGEGLVRAVALGVVVLALGSWARLGRWAGRPVWTVPLQPLAMVAFVAMALRAMVLVFVRGGVAWRGTVYPLAALRAGSRLRLW